MTSSGGTRATRVGNDDEKSSIEIVFTDLDGTCVHYPGRERSKYAALAVQRLPGLSGDIVWSIDKMYHGNAEEIDKTAIGQITGTIEGKVVQENADDGDASPAVPFFHRVAELVALPQSSSGSTGFISCKTLDMYDKVRTEKKKRLVVISGCRFSTLLERLPFIPKADVYACESGGRILYNEGGKLFEDIRWKSSMKEQLQKLAMCKEDIRRLQEEGAGRMTIKVDDKSYTTAFRVRLKGGENASRTFVEAVAGIVGSYPELAWTRNLGCIDIYPASSGKKKAAAYIAQQSGAWELAKHAVFLCDDDNDVELAEAVSKVYLPGLSDQLERFVTEDQAERGADEDKYVFAPDRSRCDPFMGTEMLLESLLTEIEKRSVS